MVAVPDRRAQWRTDALRGTLGPAAHGQAVPGAADGVAGVYQPG
jgi:hypothetical protein